MELKKISAITLSSAIALSGVVPVTIAAAESKSVVVTQQEVPAHESENNAVDKEKLIAKVKELFPNQFDMVKSSDFNVSFNPSRLGIGTETYNLDFFKEMGPNKYLNGHFEFAGKDLTLVSYYYDPVDKKDALFPAKVTKEEAQKISAAFLGKIKLKGKYQLSDENFDFLSNMNRPLTEPIMYQFTYDKLENGVPVQNKNANVTVLGNGEVTQFYYGYVNEEKNAVFESKDQVIAKNDALQLLTDNLQIDLRYLIDYDYMNDKASVKLTYVPNPAIGGIHAKTKEFAVGDKFYKEMPRKQVIKMVSGQSAAKTDKGISKEDAKLLAEKLLKPKQDNVKLQIEGIEETDRNGIKIYSINFMYYTGTGGSGSSIDINKETGEIVNYHNPNRDFYFMDQQDNKNVKPKLTEEQALKKAVEYLKQYEPSNLNQYAYPLDGTDTIYQKEVNEYYINFPRIKDGIIVSGNGLSVSVSAEDGELYSLNVNYNKVDKWPDITKAVDREKALAALKENLDVKLMYVTNSPIGNEKYRLVYTVKQKDMMTYFDAMSGTWQRYSYAGEGVAKAKPAIAHPWASEELNFLLDANIIKVDDPASLNADRTVSKGEALEILYKSLANYYDYGPRFGDAGQEKKQTFENIKPDHPLYNIVERAAEIKIIDPTVKTFNTEEKLTKEELAYWYARALGLEVVAEHDEIFAMNFTDTKEMNEKYKGHIALISGLDIFTKNAKGQFEPKKEVTLAELAVSNVRLAKIAAEMNVNFR